uniref:CSON000886 protein n=1 Tax=Culicoides sonorensis TaxID=179676 RepID=A0A336MGS7_CULSO
MIEEMKNLPHLKEDNIAAFRDFFNTVTSTVTTVRNLNCEYYLSSPELLSCLVQKLPSFNRAMWGHFKADLTRKGEICTLHHFSLWLEDELDAQFANFNPINSQFSDSNSMNFKKPQFQYNNNTNYQKKFSNFQKKATVLNHHHTESKQSRPCIICEVVPKHPLFKCEKFLKNTIDERRDLVRKHKLCFSCLNYGHSKDKCQSKNRCKICNSLHHTTLHKSNEPNKEETVLHSNNNYSNTLLRCGKVKLKGKNGIIEVFALFDDGSTASQIEDNLAKELQLEGPTVPITYQWTREITAYDPDSKVLQIEISEPSDTSKFYHLKNVRTVKNLSLPTIKFDLDNILSKYPNIETEKLVAIQNAKPKLLIGSNNSGLISPLKTISYSIYGLQLCHCRLGWTIHGDIDPNIPNNIELPDITRFSNYFRLIRSTAYYLKMKEILQMKKQDKPQQFKIDVQDMNKAKMLWYKKVQIEAFRTEYHDLKRTGYVRVHSQLKSLSPFLHNDVIRMNGRMPNILNFEENNPIILPSKHPFTELLIKTYHEANLHVGVNTVVNCLRQKFRILKCRQAVKRIFTNCAICKLNKIKIQNIQMAPLPKERTEPNIFPFTYVGIDYFGPLLIKIDRKIQKHWVCLFSCLTTRAIHMEIVASLTTNSCIMAIIRFTNIRGIPKEIVADNGKYFIGAKNELNLLVRELNNQEISAPHQAGATERLIGSVKRTLNIIMKEQFPTYEIISTTLTEIINIINNRPLLNLNADDEESYSITPNHILIGRINGEQDYSEINESEMNTTKIWKCSQIYAQRFWHRWIKEYRPELLKRSKWYDDRNEYTFKIGDIVMIIDETLKKNHWPKGIVQNLHINSVDNKVRSLTIKTSDGIYNRPVNKICILVPHQATPLVGAGEC